MSKQIVVVGSGVNYSIKEPFDFYYCANGTMSRVPKLYDDYIVHVSSADIFFDEETLDVITNAETKKIFLDRMVSLKQRAPYKTYIQPHQYSNFYHQKQVMFNYKYNPKKIISLSFAERRRLISTIASPTIWFYCWLSTSHKLSLHSIKNLYGIIFNKHTSCTFKPSTGILALIIAINNHGKDATYNMTGILNNSKISWYNDIAQPNADRSGNAGHMFIDTKSLYFLKKKYKIQFID